MTIRIYKKLLAGLVLLLSTVISAQQNTSKDTGTFSRFEAAVVKVDITPEHSPMLYRYHTRRTTGVHDHIYHRVVILDDGNTQFVLVSTDICFISPSEYDIVAAKVKKQLGIEPGHFWWTVTHTHSAPEIGSYSMGIMNNPKRFKDYKVDEK